MSSAPKMHVSPSGAEKYHRPPVLLIHGAGGHHLYWPPQVRRMHDQRLFALDLPGHGMSEGIGHQRVRDYADDVIELLRELRLNSAVLAGHSMGGAIALDVTLRFPGLVLGLCLVATGARLRVDPAILRKLADQTNFEAALQMIGERSFAAGANPRLKELAMKRMAEMRPSVLYGDLLACDTFDVMDQLSAIEVPALVMCGAEDRMTPPRYSEFLRDGIRESSLRVIDRAGHMVMLEQPDAVAESLGGLVDKIEYRPGQ